MDARCLTITFPSDSEKYVTKTSQIFLFVALEHLSMFRLNGHFEDMTQFDPAMFWQSRMSAYS